MAPFSYASDSSFEVNLELVSVIMITLHFIYEVIYSKHRRQRNTSASNFMQQQPSTRRHGTLTVYNIKQLLKPPVMPVVLTRTEFHQSSQLLLPSEIIQDLSNDSCIRAHPASTFSCYLFHVILFWCLFSVSGCLFYLF